MLFIAEIGLNYNGNIHLAFEMMRQVKAAGADIAKFQLGWRDKPGEINCLNEEDLQSLFDYAKAIDIEIMFSIFHREALSLIRKFDVKRYKVASRTTKDDPDLIIDMLGDEKETIISLGMSMNEVPDGLPDDDNIKYLWCKSKYPTMPWDISDMPENFRYSVPKYDGFSDHTLGIEAALIAIARGATIIEKHVTLDKTDNTIRDHVVSCTPDEFAIMVKLGKAMHNYTRLMG